MASELSLRRGDLIIGKRGDRVVIGRDSGTGTAPIWLEGAELRWLLLVAGPAVAVELERPAPAPPAPPVPPTPRPGPEPVPPPPPPAGRTPDVLATLTPRSVEPALF